MEGDFMSFLDIVKGVGKLFERARDCMTQISEERLAKKQSALLTTIENKVAFLKTQILDSVDIDELEEADELLTFVCEDYNYDSSN